MVIDVIGLEHDSRKFGQQIIFFVRGAIRPDDSDRASRHLWSRNFAKAPANQFKSFLPCRQVSACHSCESVAA